MSIKKELLDEMTEQQLKKLAENKGFKFDLSEAQKKYYDGWEERDVLVDVISDTEDISLKEIENYLKLNKS